MSGKPRLGRLRLRDVMPRDLFRRSLLMVAVPVILLFSIATWFFFERHWETVQRRLIYGTTGEIAFLVQSFEAGGLPADIAILLERTTQVRCVPHGQERDFENPALWRRPTITALDRALNGALPNNPHRTEGVFGDDLHLSFETERGRLDCRFPIKQVSTSTTFVFLAWVLGTALLVLGLAAFFLWKQVVPVRRLAVAMDAFGRGEDLGSIQERGADEIRRAARAFERMKARIQRQVRRRTEMLAAISHDLRTPLSRMRIEVEMLGDGVDKEGLRQDIGDMEGMIQGYLDFARDQVSEPTREVDMVDLVIGLASTFRHDQVDVQIGTEAPLMLRVRPDAVRRAIGNVVGNALRYGGHCWIGLTAMTNTVRIIVDDDGPGIPADRRADVFRPFVRLDESRNAATGGVGLGLTIARDIVLTHGGDITVEASPRGGARFVVALAR
ncbi:MAG: HAMP domain-containing protein [Alphaproteobacteria bacterium]|nr:HAMP domain-containing protein [Alphaproteobacteria bacterium]MCB9931602.1 HAMP domain-containing protein [Alphaproteobacteria bacterium]